MTNYYDENAKSFFETTVHLDLKDLYEPFLTRLPKFSVIMDLGCGPGRDAAYFKSLGHKVVAIDSSKELAKLANENFGVVVQVRDFKSIDYTEEFDGVWACASLLHVQKKDLPEIFLKVEKALKKSGTVYASFKYGEFDGERNGRHFSDFTEKELKRMLAEFTRLTIRNAWTTIDRRPEKMNEKWLNVLLWKE